MRALLASALMVLLLPRAPAVAQGLPYRGTLELRPPLRVQAAGLDEATTRIHLQGPRRSLEQTLPGVAEAIDARVLRLARGRRLGLVEARGPQGHWALVVDARRGPRVLWSGRLDWHGDPGERRRDVLLVDDRTGDGAPDLLVGVEHEDRRICGQTSTLLSPRALDPRTGELRSVTLRRLPERPGEPVVTATREAHPEPLLRALVPASASSHAGRGQAVPPVELTDGDPSTGWVEGRPGPGRWEFATLRWQASHPIRAVALTVGPPPITPPRHLWLVHEAGRLRVTLPEGDPGTWWVPLPEAARTRCLSLVLDDAHDGAEHVGIAEVRAYTDVDLGSGIEGLLADLAADGPAAAEAERLLAAIGAPALRTLTERWNGMGPGERRRALRVFAAHPSTEPGRAGLLRAVEDPSPEVRRAALDAILEAGALPPLLELLQIGGEAGDAAALTLSRRHPHAAAPALLDALADEGGWDRPALRRALRTAYQRGADDEALHRWLGQAPSSARAAAALALAGGGETLRSLATEAFRAAVAVVDEEAPFPDRWRLTQAASRLGPDEEVDVWLRGAFRAAEWMLRAAALDALRRRGAPGLSAVAREGLRDEYPRVRRAAIRALAAEGLRGRDVERVALRARRDPWPMVRAVAVGVLRPLERARPILHAALGDPSPVVRAAAVEALHAAGDLSAWPAVRARLEDDREWPQVLLAAIRFARARCRGDALPALAAVVDRALRPDPWAPDVAVAVEALSAAASIGGEESRALLRRAGGPGSPAPLRNAAEAAASADPCRAADGP